MNDDQFEALMYKLDEINQNLSDLSSINNSLQTIASRVGSIKDNSSTFHVLKEIQAEIGDINSKV